MEENKLFDQIKSAAENAETKDFPGMEKVWNRVEEKLDNKIVEKAAWRWKKIAVAASVLLFATLGYQFLKNDESNIKSKEVITQTDTIKKKSAADAVVVTEPTNPVIKKEAEEILKVQINPTNQIALEENVKVKAEELNFTTTAVPIEANKGTYSLSTGTQSEAKWAADRDDDNGLAFKAKKSESKNVEMFLNKDLKISNNQKEEPLVVIDNKASKRDLREHEFTESDSLVVLKEPLYIINGVEFTEQEVFGPNPTSPYTPLNKQEIETISVLQSEKAVETYGKKGQKGVVVITTKNGKPKASKKAK